jgi:hypothetical protein
LPGGFKCFWDPVNCPMPGFRVCPLPCDYELGMVQCWDSSSCSIVHPPPPGCVFPFSVGVRTCCYPVDMVDACRGCPPPIII